MTLAVTGMDTGVHKFFHIERDEIQATADRFVNGVKYANERIPITPYDHAIGARMVLEGMLVHGTGLPDDPILDCAAAYLFTTSSGWEAVEGPSKIIILRDRFIIKHVDHDLEKMIRHWEAKLNAVPAEGM